MDSALYPTPGDHSSRIAPGTWTISETKSTDARRARAGGAGASMHPHRMGLLQAVPAPVPRPRGPARQPDPIFQADGAAMTIARALGEIDPWLAASAAEYKGEKVW